MDQQLSNELIQGYNILLQQQSSHFNIILTILVIEFSLITFLTFVWNFWAARQRIKTSVSFEIEKFEKKFEEEKAKLSSKSDELAKNVTNETNLLNANMARNYALLNEDRKYFVNASVWWSTAIYYYSKAESKQKMLRMSVDSLRLIIKNPDWKKDVEAGDLTKENFESIKTYINLIPDILLDEKSEIKRQLESVKSFVK